MRQLRVCFLFLRSSHENTPSTKHVSLFRSSTTAVRVTQQHLCFNFAVRGFSKLAQRTSRAEERRADGPHVFQMVAEFVSRTMTEAKFARSRVSLARDLSGWHPNAQDDTVLGSQNLVHNAHNERPLLNPSKTLSRSIWAFCVPPSPGPRLNHMGHRRKTASFSLWRRHTCVGGTQNSPKPTHEPARSIPGFQFQAFCRVKSGSVGGGFVPRGGDAGCGVLVADCWRRRISSIGNCKNSAYCSGNNSNSLSLSHSVTLSLSLVLL